MKKAPAWAQSAIRDDYAATPKPKVTPGEADKRRTREPLNGAYCVTGTAACLTLPR